MSAIEDIRAAAHAEDFGPFARNIDSMIRLAYEGGEAHHYLARNATPAMVDLMVKRVCRIAKPVPHANGNLYNYETWRIPIPCAMRDHIAMHLSRDFALNVWQIGAYNTLAALAWIWCEMARTGVKWTREREGYIEGQLWHAQRTVEALDVLEAQKHVGDLAMNMSWIEVQEMQQALDEGEARGLDLPLSLMRDVRAKWDKIEREVNLTDAVRRAFASTFVDMWLGREARHGL